LPTTPHQTSAQPDLSRPDNRHRYTGLPISNHPDQNGSASIPPLSPSRRHSTHWVHPSNFITTTGLTTRGHYPKIQPRTPTVTSCCSSPIQNPSSISHLIDLPVPPFACLSQAPFAVPPDVAPTPQSAPRKTRKRSYTRTNLLSLQKCPPSTATVDANHTGRRHLYPINAPLETSPSRRKPSIPRRPLTGFPQAPPTST